MGIIGGFNNWAGDAPMTWNPEEYCFEATNVGVTADGWKFRVNGDWPINLGGSLNNLTRQVATTLQLLAKLSSCILQERQKTISTAQ